MIGIPGKHGGMAEEKEPAASAWTIRPAQAEEPEWCAQLMSQSDPWITLGRTQEQCRSRCSNPEWELVVAVDSRNGSLGGFLLLDPQGVIGFPYIASVAVAAEFRSQGLGQMLIRYVEERYQPSRKFVFLCVSSFNERARSLYFRLGFKAVGVLESFVVEGLDEWLLYKRLDRHNGI